MRVTRGSSLWSRQKGQEFVISLQLPGEEVTPRCHWICKFTFLNHRPVPGTMDGKTQPNASA